MRRPQLFVLGVLLGGCALWPAPDFGSACDLDAALTGPDEPTLAGPTAAELVAPWEGASFAVTWAEDGPPLPEVFADLQLDHADLSTTSAAYRDTPECPAVPRVEVHGRNGTLGPLVDMRFDLNFCEAGPTCPTSGEPRIGGEIPISPPLHDWLLDQLRASDAPPAEPVVFQGNVLSLIADLGTGILAIDATYTDADGAPGRLSDASCPEACLAGVERLLGP